jgi:2-polyprenyl-3-methyl-5-hydroxy-6-metoxy-1,4-benzoquinol methylase
LETVACNLCGSRNHTPVYEIPDRKFFPDEIFQVVECNDCGLGFVNPRPTFQEIAKYYPAEYYRSPGTGSFDKYLTRRFSTQASFLQGVRNGNGPRTLLDVGCANGEFPRFMAARGWKVAGVEVSACANRNADFPIYPQEFQNIPVCEPTYDVVTAWAVLEHVHDPATYFHKAAQVLKPGGLLVFLVPNFQSTASRHLFCEDVPRHLYFFTDPTVSRYLENSGFTLEKTDNNRNIYKVAPQNILQYTLRTKLLRHKFTYSDIPLSSRQYRQKHGLTRGLKAAIKYTAYSPLSVIDRMLWPLIESAQILRGTYGNTTYVARKRLA